MTNAAVPDADCCAAGIPLTITRMFHQAFTRSVCIWSVWDRANVVAPEGIMVIVFTACCPLPATSGGAGEKDSFVNTSVAAAGEPIRSATDMRIRTAAAPADAGDLPGIGIPMKDVPPLIVKLVVVGE